MSLIVWALVSWLQKTLIKEEEQHYKDRMFGKTRIATITSLKGDSLQTFVDRYQPTADILRKMTDYDVLMYIRSSYAKFTQPASHEK